MSVHKNRGGQPLIDYMCSIGRHAECGVTSDVYDAQLFICHCADPECTHKVQCDGSCQKPTVTGRRPSKFVGSTAEEMGY